MTYNGFPWRSRFLRGPKIGLELADRPDFVALGTLATVRLGLKSGSDKFFFVTATGKGTTSRLPIRGLKNFESLISRADLIGGLQSPKELDTPQGRQATVPTSRGRYSGTTYYFAPRSNRLDRAAREYVAWGELQNVHDLTLVKANADDSGWFRQTRSQVRSPWALPYNSGYDYGAIDNSIGALLNGRFIGVEPIAGVDSTLLGAVLNSTPVALMRLLEGVATGNEGAFDVGPPSARVMQVPDPQRMSPTAAEAVTDAYGAITSHGYLPASPDASGSVTPLRRNLDLAVLSGLGMTRGEATVLTDRIYASYGRWRKAVEAVEDQMQVHRRNLAKRGGSRTESPMQRTVRTVWEEISPTVPLLFAALTSEDFEIVDPILDLSDDGTQSALFADAEFPTPDGTRVDLKDQRRVELARKVRELGYTGPLPLPSDPAHAQQVRDQMLVLQAVTTADVERRAQSYVNVELVEDIVAQVVRKWVGKSIASLREELKDVASITVNGPDLFVTDGLVPPPGEPT